MPRLKTAQTALATLMFMVCSRIPPLAAGPEVPGWVRQRGKNVADALTAASCPASRRCFQTTPPSIRP